MTYISKKNDEVDTHEICVYMMYLFSMLPVICRTEYTLLAPLGGTGPRHRHIHPRLLQLSEEIRALCFIYRLVYRNV